MSEKGKVVDRGKREGRQEHRRDREMVGITKIKI